MTTAGAFNPEDAESMDHRRSADEINSVSFIVSVNAAFALPVTDRTGLSVDVERFHAGIKERFC